MPCLSIVVPIYNVEPYLDECLDSLARQTFTDLEVVMVDDGSTDGSAAIAQEFSARDARFKLIRQPNGGLSAARNTGLEAAAGEFIAFVDSDDVVAPGAYELLVGSLEQSGSDIASGNVHRLTTSGSRQARFLARTFAQTRLSTHITRDPLLLYDRTAWNKVWRRAFWDREGRRFPEGRLYEDIPVTIPLHFAAQAVDVHSEVVYYWRTREGVDRSITQQRAEPRALRDRLTAIAEVSDYLASHGLRKEKRWYDASVVADDLKYFLNVLDEGDDDYRTLFLDRVNDYLDGVSARAFRRLRANERLKWHLVRRRMLPELLEILRFQREDMPDTTPVLVRGHWYLDHPYRTDRRLKIPGSLFRVDRELPFSTGLDALEWQDGRLRIEGWAYIDGIGAAERRSQHITLTAVPPGRLQSVRRRIGGVRMRAEPVHRPDLVRANGTELADVTWAGFRATLDARRLRTAGRWREGRWDLYITMRTGRLWRAKARFGTDSARPLRAAEAALPGGVLVATAPSPEGQIALRVHTAWAAVQEHRRDGDALELTGEAHGIDAQGLELVARRRGGGGGRKWPATLAGTRLTARVPLASLPREDAIWDLFLAGGGTRRQVTLDPAAGDGAWRQNGHEVALERAMDGGAALAVRRARATIRAAGWTEDGALELAGDARLPDGPHELVLRGRYRLLEHAFSLDRGPGADEFHVRLRPAALPATLAGVLPLNADTWEVLVRAAGQTEGTPVTLAAELYDRLPLRKVIHHKPFRLGMTPEGDAILVVDPDRDDEERGRRQQRRLRTTAYFGRREAPLREAVLFESFGGRQYSDNPRAIHEELVRRDTGLEQLWLVRDGRCRVPETARVVRSGSREHYELMATARFVVTNDHFPHWFARRPDQTCLQTWHGTPLKRLGYDVPPGARPRKFERNWDQQMDNWQYVLSPNAFTTPILRRAYTIRGQVLETGYPRNDVLAGERRAAATTAVRERLGLPEGARVVLYAPTYRDDARDRSGRYRLDPALDIARLRAALGEDDVLLFRKHHYVVDPVPVTADGAVRDVSAYPDGTELMLAADVLVTDYSSMMFDFANTGRPMLFYTYDLDEYRDEVRGFYVDFEAKAPGPLLRTTDELAAALRDLDSVSAAYAERYRAFAQEFCALDDGQAAARVVDHLFSSG
jgi:CDP-glycerol glycerophosphotransferase